MGKAEEFETHFNDAYEQNLPQKFKETYYIIECLSCSEGCDTLLVKQKTSGKKLVAKCYTQGNLLFARKEVAAFRKFKSKAVPNYVGEYRNETSRCVLREYVDGISLDKFVKNNRMTEERIVEIAIELAKAMRELHNSKPVIIHRDIKPQNIIVQKDGRIALIDFGISRVFKKNETYDTHFCGTESFAAPEQYGFMQTDIRSDIYSFGVVLAWMLTGKARPIRNPLNRLERVAAKCCEFSPNKRYQNDVALLRNLYKETRKYKARVQKRKRRCFACLVLLTAAHMCAVCIPFRRD